MITEQNKILHKKFVFYGANAKEWMKKCVLLLPEIEKNEIWKKKGFSSIYEYAAKLAGMNREKVVESLRVLNKIGDKPALMAVAIEKGIGVVTPIATIATRETEKLWAEKARELSKHELEFYVKGLKNQGEIFPEDLNLSCLPGKTAEPENFGNFVKKEGMQAPVLMDLDPEVLDQLKKLKGDSDWNALMKEFLALREEKFEKQKPPAEETESRHIPKEIKDYVLQKFNYRCAFPNCTKKYSVLHHVDRFAFTKEHDPDNIVPLCDAHHSLDHRGLVRKEIDSTKIARPEKWRLRMLKEEVVQTELDELMCRRKAFL